MNPSQKAVPGNKDPRAVAHDQQSDSPDGIMREGVSDHRMRQPNERDEAPDGGHLGTDRKTDMPQTEMPRAHADIEKGLVDTERRGVPANVPSSRKNRAP